MHARMQALLVAVAVVQLLFAVGFFFQIPLVLAVWPFPNTTPLTFIFVASILAAAGASHLWVAWSKQWGAAVGIALDYIVMLGAVALFTGQKGVTDGNTAFMLSSAVCIGGLLFGVALFVWSRRFRLDNAIPTPAPVRWSFVLFAILLILVSVQLIRQVPNVLPWQVTPDLSVLVGLMFLGAATYFIYGAVRPAWSNAAGQLAGFLAYDLVLLVPFFSRLPGIAPEFQLSLWIYTAVVVYSGVLAFYYLFVSSRTRRLNAPSPALSG